MSLFDSPAIPIGSTILVTGVNGYTASHLAEQLLDHGYRVRGTVRDVEKHAWLAERFDKKFCKGAFQLIEVEDIAKDDAFDSAIRGVSGVAHLASVRPLSPDLQSMISDAIAGTLVCLRCAAKEPTVKRFVMTSSSAAVRTLADFVGTKPVTADEYAVSAIELVKAMPDSTPELHRRLATYYAAKVRSEQVFWEWIMENKPAFVANTVLPPAIFGRPLDVVNQGYPSSSRVPLMIYDGEIGIKHLHRFYYIDVEDLASLHIASLLHPQVENERVFAFANTYTINDFFAIYKKLSPMYKAHEDIPGLDYELSPIVGRERAELLLKQLGSSGFKGLEDTLKGNIALHLSLHEQE